MKICRIIAIIGLFAISMGAQGVDEFLDLKGTGQLTKVRLPFPYLSKEDESRLPGAAIFLPQGTFDSFVSYQTKHPRIWVTGVLSPCIGLIALYKNAAGKVLRGIVSHVDYTCDVRTLLGPIRGLKGKSLKFDPQRFSCTLFTHKADVYDTEFVGRHPVTSAPFTFRDFNGGRSQVEEIERIQEILCGELGADRSNVFSQVYESDLRERELGQYLLAPLQLAIKSDGTINTISHYRTNPLRIKQPREDGLDITDPLGFVIEEFIQKERWTDTVCNMRAAIHGGDRKVSILGQLPIVSVRNIFRMQRAMNRSMRLLQHLPL